MRAFRYRKIWSGCLQVAALILTYFKANFSTDFLNFFWYWYCFFIQLLGYKKAISIILIGNFQTEKKSPSTTLKVDLKLQNQFVYIIPRNFLIVSSSASSVLYSLYRIATSLPGALFHSLRNAPFDNPYKTLKTFSGLASSTFFISIWIALLRSR